RALHENIIKATEDFSSDYCIGSGGYRSVYKAALATGQMYDFCSHPKHSFLVYKLVERGSLRMMLSNNEQSKELDWKKRLNVVKGLANALYYMHHGHLQPIVHRDISSNNVLLDLDYEAHVFDFGPT
ncbi:hypothetical protein Godav_023943, partial [Gossypium davidsonii]|nr:hypothetical protein [Gossypium davidsonii]